MSATISQGLQAVTNGLRNQDTDRKLEFIEELQRLGVSKYVDLPQVGNSRHKEVLATSTLTFLSW